jgi:signal transduction histidine kinase/CheY-like chemotaxis protein
VAGDLLRTDQQATARILAAVARLVVPGALALVGAAAVAFPDHLWRMAGHAAAILVIGAVVQLCLRAGRVRLAAYLGLAGLMAFVTVVSATSAGVRGPVWPAYLLAIVLATLVLGERAGVATTLATVVALGVMAAVEEAGHLPAPAVHHTPLTHLGVSLVLVLGVVVAQIHFARAVRGSTEVARQEAEERRLAEVALRRAQKSEAIATLARGVAHDFNNLLAAIMGNAQSLARELPPEADAREAAAEILQAARRGRDVVRQLMAFAAGREGEARPVRLDELGAEVVSLLRASAPATVELRLEPGEPAAVVADPTQVHQALLNVATNAVQSLGTGPGLVRLSISAAELPPPGRPEAGLPPGRYRRAVVADTGPGMTAEVASRIFDPFFTTRPLGQGTGLGLSVVQGIMKGLGGAVTVESAPGRGATFTLWFPEPSAAALSAVTPAPEPRQAARAALPERLRVLVVDDEAAVAAAGARLLERRGCQVTVLGGPEAAATAVRVDPAAVDVAVVDLAMPGLDGLSVLATLRRERPDLPAVLVSGDLEAADPGKLAALQPLVRLPKPFSQEALERALGDALRRSARAPRSRPA